MNIQLRTFTYLVLAFAVPGLSTNPAASGDAVVCDKGEFLVHSPRRQCEHCDEHCTPGHCFDFVGCVQCADGFYSQHSERGAPFECLECVLPNCQTCVANAVECGGPATCVRCLAGFTFDENFNCTPRVLPEEETASSSDQQVSQLDPAAVQEAMARRRPEFPRASHLASVGGTPSARRSASSEAVSEPALTTSSAPIPAPDAGFEDNVALYMDLEEESSPSPSVGPAKTPQAAPESLEEEEGSVLSSYFQRSWPDAEDQSSNNGSSSSYLPCPLHHFFWNVSIPCMKCDDHAAPGACKNFIGCLSCLSGYFRHRLEKDSPFTCAPCTVPNCAVCQDDVLMGSPVRCKVCYSGFNLIEETGSCIPA